MASGSKTVVESVLVPGCQTRSRSVNARIVHPGGSDSGTSITEPSTGSVCPSSNNQMFFCAYGAFCLRHSCISALGTSPETGLFCCCLCLYIYIVYIFFGLAILVISYLNILCCLCLLWRGSIFWVYASSPLLPVV